MPPACDDIAEILRIDPPEWDQPSLAPDVTLVPRPIQNDGPEGPF